MLYQASKPAMPVLTKIYSFPAGTTLQRIFVDIETQSYLLEKKLSPSPVRYPTQSSPIYEKSFDINDPHLYDDLMIYPDQMYTVEKSMGLKDDHHVLSVHIRIPPQYIPAKDTLLVPTKASIVIQHEPPKQSLFTADEYDLLIITDSELVEDLQPLVDHKTAYGIKTIMETTEEIYSSYDGYDEQEEIKLRIKNAIEEWGISYVLLAGGRKGQSNDWYVPVRETNNFNEPGYSSDLYYADIYKEDNGTPVFDDWDSNDNNIYAEYSANINKKDIIDHDPDVAIGRLPIRYPFETALLVDKSITYETSANDSWFKDAYVISGDTGPPSRSPAAVKGIYEGELTVNISANWLETVGFSVTRLFTSTGTFSSKSDVLDAINQGSGFIHMAGHGNPAYWGNFLPDAKSEEGMIDGLQLQDMPTLRNGDKLPVIIVGGCHNAQFNVTMQNLLHEILTYGFRGTFFAPLYRFFYMEWVPRCFCEWLVLCRNGGAIASTGCSGLGLGYYNTVGLGDWLDSRFFDVYANQSVDVLGDVHRQALRDYVHLIGNVNSDEGDRQTVQEWILFGDPS